MSMIKNFSEYIKPGKYLHISFSFMKLYLYTFENEKIIPCIVLMSLKLRADWLSLRGMISKM